MAGHALPPDVNRLDLVLWVCFWLWEFRTCVTI